MNAYLDQICVTASMVKQARNDNELRDTAVIGAMGVGTGLASNHIANKLKLNDKVPGAIKASGSLLSRAGTMLKSPGFKNTAKIGAIAGSLGLIGDYAAVKINKALNKQASYNKYVAYIAQNTD